MILLRRSSERSHRERRRREVWQTFFPEDRAEPLANGFGALQFFNEERLPPGASVQCLPNHDADVFTYVREGALAYEDSGDHSGLISAGEFQCLTSEHGIRRETNASRSNWAHFFQLWLRPSDVRVEPGREEKRFGAGQRRGGLCVIASPDGRRGSLRIHQDTQIFSAILDPGQHVIHELAQGRGAWLHLLDGEATLGDIVLTEGDSAGVVSERAISLTAREETEILLLDLGEPLPRPKAILKLAPPGLGDLSFPVAAQGQTR